MKSKIQKISASNEQKSRKTKINLLIALGAVILTLILSSYTLTPSQPETIAATTVINPYYQVQEFVMQNICEVLEKDLNRGNGSISSNHFSRCPSGYSPNITTKKDSVTPDRYVNGRIVLYRGCSSEYVCDFKVCKSNNFIMVRSKGSSYMSLRAWIDRQNSKPAKVAIRN